MLRGFTGRAKPGFARGMALYWVEEGCFPSIREARKACKDPGFVKLCQRLNSGVCSFKPYLGYPGEPLDETICFEETDNSYVIPVNLVVKEEKAE